MQTSTLISNHNHLLFQRDLNIALEKIGMNVISVHFSTCQRDKAISLSGENTQFSALIIHQKEKDKT